MSMMVSFCAVFFPQGVLDEILNLIESVSEGFPSYSFTLVRRLDYLYLVLCLFRCIDVNNICLPGVTTLMEPISWGYILNWN